MKENHQFKEADCRFMALALKQARAALHAGDYPVGAVLVIDGGFAGKARNSILADAQSTAHAEMKLLTAHSPQLRQIFRSRASCELCLYTTLEPCLMCLGAAVLHRISRIVVACPDPHGGTTKLNPAQLGIFYHNHWPVIESGLMKAESADLIIQFLKTRKFLSWEIMLAEFSKMRAAWQ